MDTPHDLRRLPARLALCPVRVKVARDVPSSLRVRRVDPNSRTECFSDQGCNFAAARAVRCSTPFFGIERQVDPSRPPRATFTRTAQPSRGQDTWHQLVAPRVPTTTDFHRARTDQTPLPVLA